jgi:hypothetical protein
VADVVYVGAVAPENYVLDLTPGTTGIDLTTVSAAILRVQDPEGNETTWAVVSSNITATTLTLTHDFIAGDIALSGPYVVYAELTIPAGTVRSLPRTRLARGRFET